jgi:solute carrier family 7 (L-type amino acid transporter), member 6
MSLRPPSRSWPQTGGSLQDPQEFATRTLGGWGGLLYSVAVSISAMGALNANTFATAILAVRASQRGYLPSMLANSHCAGVKHEDGYLDAKLPVVMSGLAKWLAARTRRLRWNHSVPV